MNSSTLFSLKNNVHERFKEIFDIVKRDGVNQTGQMILVVDEYSASILSSALTMQDLLKFGVSCIEKLELKRKKFPKQEAIYIIQPSQISVQNILKDSSKKDNPQYNRIHIFFTSKLNKELLKQLAVQSIVLRIKTIKEIYHDFFFSDQNSFYFNQTTTLSQLYAGGDTIAKKLIEDEISSKLITVLPGLLNFQTFSIITSQNKDCVSQKFSNILSQKIYEYKERLRIEKSKYLDEQCGHVYIMIFDRVSDPVTPLIHDLYYESMMYDLLDIDQEHKLIEINQDSNKNEQKRDKNEQKKDDNLRRNLNDEIFEKYRYQNISDCLKGISEDFQTFANKNKSMQNNKSDIEAQDLEDAEHILNKLPEYQEKYENHKMHLSKIESCFKIFQERNLIELAELEQKLITGVDTSAKRIKPKSIKKQLFQVLFSSSVNDDCKLRLALIALLTLNFDAKERQQLNQNFSEQDQRLFQNLNWIDKKGNSQDINALKPSEQLIKHTKQKVKNFKQGVDVEFCRHTPEIALQIQEILKIILNQNENNQQNKLQSVGFNIQQIQKEMNSNIYLEQQASSQTNGSPTKKYQVNIEMQNLLRDKQQSTDLTNQNMIKNSNKFIVFVLGGITHSEVRSIRQIHEFSHNQLPLVLGSTQILTPQQYIQSLQQMQSYQ